MRTVVPAKRIELPVKGVGYCFWVAIEELNNQ